MFAAVSTLESLHERIAPMFIRPMVVTSAGHRHRLRSAVTKA
jgi:hypothetical protein